LKLIFSEKAWEDYLYWQKNDKMIVKRINTLIKDIVRSPYEGIGKLEELRHVLVYKVKDDAVLIAQLRYHY
jgi:toxin YoeB